MPSADTGLSLADLAGKQVAVVGVGREGIAVSRMLGQRVPGVTLIALDQRDGTQAAAWRSDSDIPLAIIEDPADLPAGIDVAVVSPGFAPHNPLIQALDQAGIARTSGTDLFFSEHSSRTIGVTGSKGKSTTSALIHHLLNAHGIDAVLGGNVGIPLWDVPQAAWIVAEVSSFQASSLHYSPHTAVLTALFDEHRDWHGSFEAYARDKLNLVGHNPAHVVVNTSQELLVENLKALHPGLPRIDVGSGTSWDLVNREGATWLAHGETLIVRTDELPLAGAHNAWNALVALAAVNTVVSLDVARAAQALRSFQPLPHRLQPVADESGVEFINDSLATNPPALAAALASLRHRRVIAIVGGSDRGVDQQALRDEVIAHPPAAVIGIPDSGEALLGQIASWLDEAGIDHQDWPVRVAVSDMVEAVTHARELAAPGDVVLLSPGAPSFGRYRDYQDRAEQFIAAVHQSAPGNN